MSQQQSASASLAHPLHNLSKAQVRELAKVIARSNTIQATLKEAEAAIGDNRFVVAQAMSPQKTLDAVTAIRLAERNRDRAQGDQKKVDELFERRPYLGERFGQYQSLVKAVASGDVSARKLLGEVETDLTIATASVPRRAAKGGAAKGATEAVKDIEDAGEVAKTILNGIAAVAMPTPAIAAAATPLQAMGHAAALDAKPARRREPNELQEPARYPPHLLNRYLIQGNEVKDKRTESLVFVDKGDEFKAPGNADREAITAMLDTAEVRGWSAIKVFGTDAFKAAAWMEAASRGLSVEGYKPSQEEQAAAAANRKLNGKENSISANPIRQAFLDATTAEAKAAAVKSFPALAQAFAVETAIEKSFTRTFGKGSPALQEMMETFRDQLGARLERGDVLPDVALRDRTPQRSQERNTGDQER